MAVDTLIARYGREYDRLRVETGRQVLAVWEALAGPDDARAAAFVDAVVPLVAAGQLLVAELVDAYLAEYVSQLTGAPTVPAGVDPEIVAGAAVRGGTAPVDVYQRGVVTLRRLLGEGRPWPEAFGQAADRMRSTAETDVVLAHRAAARSSMETLGVQGFRRVLTGRSCLLCATASTQRYRTEDLMPIHSHCDCRVAPIVGDRDPGRVVNRQLLRTLKAETGRSDYWNARGVVDESGRLVDDPPAIAAVRDHGELGPVLTDAAHDFDDL